MQYTFFVIVAPFLTLTCLIVSVYAWRAKGVIGSRWLSWYALLSFFYLGLNIIELTFSDERSTLLAAKLQYVIITLLPTLMFVFAMEYSGKNHWVSDRIRYLLGVMPAFIVVMVFTNDLHHLVWSETVFEKVGSRLQYLALHVSYGDMFYAGMIYTYILCTISILMILYTYNRTRNTLRNQGIWICIAALVPVIPNLVYVFHLIPGFQKDYTSLSFSLSTIFFAIGILRYQLFDLMPIAHSLLIENMPDGVILLDQDGRLAEINPTAESWLSLSKNDLGKPLQLALTKQPELSAAIYASTTVKEINLLINQKPYTFEITVTPLTKYLHRTIGMLITLHDITDRVVLYRQIEDMASYDSMTGLKNRRAFIEQTEIELHRANRYRHPISMMLIDIDFFKQINDSYGHAAGDSVLIGFSNVLQQAMRNVDIMARFAGDEFIILLPEISPENTMQAARRLQSCLNSRLFHIAEADFKITVSIGIACLNQDEVLTFDNMFECADKALYYAKNHGRNQFIIWNESIENQGKNDLIDNRAL